jgi:cell division septation protein DedD
MALTSGFKKFIGLVVFIGVAGGGVYYWQHMPKKKDVFEQPIAVPDNQPTPTPVQAQQPDPVPVQQPAQVQEPAPVQQAPVQQPAQADASSNRGMQFLLKQGSK